MTMRETRLDLEMRARCGRCRQPRPRPGRRGARAAPAAPPVCVFLFDWMLFASVGAYRTYTSYYRARTGWPLPRTRCPAGSRL